MTKAKGVRSALAGFLVCMIGQGCTSGLVTSLGASDRAADAQPYDGSLDAFADFVERQGKDWPLPSEMEMFNGSDGARLRYAHWPAPDPEVAAGVVVFFQGRTEFIEKNIYTYQDLLKRNYEVWTLDWRGQGKSERMLPDEPEKGHIDSYDTFLADADIFLRDVVGLPELEGAEKILMAHSMGGAIGTLYLMEHPDMFDKAVFSSPMIKLPDRVDNKAIRAGNLVKITASPAACAGIFTDCSWTSDFKEGTDICAIDDRQPATYLSDPDSTAGYSHDFRKVAEYECLIAESRPLVPSLGLGRVTSGWLRASFEATDKIEANKEALTTPLLIVAGGKDDVVSNPGQAAFCDIDNPSCCRIEIEGAGHEVLIEKEDYRQQFFKAFKAFVASEETPEAFCAGLN